MDGLNINIWCQKPLNKHIYFYFSFIKFEQNNLCLVYYELHKFMYT